MTKNLPLFARPGLFLVTTILLVTLGMLTMLNTARAAGESTDILVNIIHDQYVHLTGTAVGSSRTFSVDTVKPPDGSKPLLNLGTLGLESNFAANCTMDFSTQNNFKLRHTVSNRRLTRYILKYRNKRITRRKHSLDLPCNTTPGVLAFKRRGKFRKKVKSGVYADVVTITVTTQ